MSRNEQNPLAHQGVSSCGPGWTRTTDLILIRDAL
jgi:hypothetical protein